MGDLFDGYGAALVPASSGAAFDEMFRGPGEGDDAEARAPYADLHATLGRMTQKELRGRADALASSYLAQGVTFDFAGEERPFPLDAVPRVIASEEWTELEAGVKQRVRALEAFLDDAYGRQEAVKDGVIPAGLIATSAHFHRQAAGIASSNGVRCHVSGIDLIRDEHGTWRVLEDNVRVPSGVSYVISNRRVMAQTLPELFVSMSVRPVGDYPYRLLQALRASAPVGIDDPVVVVLTPGVYNSAYYEHTLLARLMGVELVEGRDLYVSGGHVWMRTTGGPTRVDVIYRRVDDEFLDPLQFRADSVLGTPGLLTAARLGNVTLANAVGNGVADDKLTYTYLPELIRYYLGENPIIPNVDTWRLEDPGSLEEVLDRLDELVVKPVDGSGGKGLVIGPAASRKELDALRTKLIVDPRGWIAQPVVQLSTIPTLVEDGMQPRHSDLRPFAVNDGEDIWVLPGGLTRVALPAGQLVVNSSQGGGSKDTWVLGRPTPPTAGIHDVAAITVDQATPTSAIPIIGSPALHDMAPGAGTAPQYAPEDDPAPSGQQQQQQQSRTSGPTPEDHPEVDLDNPLRFRQQMQHQQQQKMVTDAPEQPSAIRRRDDESRAGDRTATPPWGVVLGRAERAEHARDPRLATTGEVI
ncbi:MAG TPA: circularly permuted type 2 ATP-grasp protein [Gryllotalpicola sp.]